MTAIDGDGIDEDLTRTVSVAMLAAARAGEQFSRMTQAQAQQRQARAAGDAERAQRQLAAHTESAKAYFEVVTRPEYLTAATDEQIREVTRQAQAWQHRLPEAQTAADAATRELGARRPGEVDNRAAVLAVEGDAADRRARENPRVTDQNRTAESVVVPAGQQSARQAADTAHAAQARPATEAPASGRGKTARAGNRSVAQPTRHTGIER